MSAAVRTVSPMSQQVHPRHHTFDYVELAAPDLTAAKQFYADAFGWTFTDYGPDYTGIRRPGDEGEMGGLNPVRPPGPGLPLVILYSDDLDATLDAVRASGGEVTEEPFEFPGGRRFHFTDPFGNALAVWSQA
jgi:predicted enzyme related to lactoylglutathione lyase